MITNLEPNVVDSGMYTSTDTAKILGISRNTLIKYTNMGIIKRNYRKVTLRPFYYGGEIRRFWREHI